MRGGRNQHAVRSDFELALILKKRDEHGFNSFWLKHGDEPFPTIWISTNFDHALLHYYPKEDHPGFRSLRLVSDLAPDGETMFHCACGIDLLMPNSSAIPLSRALDVAKEFAGSKWLPRCIEWFEL